MSPDEYMQAMLDKQMEERRPAPREQRGRGPRRRWTRTTRSSTGDLHRVRALRAHLRDGPAGVSRLRSATRVFSQFAILNPRVAVRATEHAPRGPFNVHERRHGLAEIVESWRPPVALSASVSPLN